MSQLGFVIQCRARFALPLLPRIRLGYLVKLTARVDVRISPDTMALLDQEAEKMGIGPNTLARMLILEGLKRIKAAKATKKPRPGRASQSPGNA